jgi:hypothetical protein
VHSLGITVSDGAAASDPVTVQIRLLSPELVVNTELDLPDATPGGDGIVDVDLVAAGNQISLRAAIQEARSLDADIAIDLTTVSPEEIFSLTQSGASSVDPGVGDLDIHSSITIVGSGAGITVLDGGGAAGLNDRIFEVHSGGSLTLEQLTVTGGDTLADGGGVYVHSGGALTLDEVAVVGNVADGTGGGISNAGVLSMNRSVVAGNSADEGGGVYSAGGSSQYADSVIAKNAALDDADVLITDGVSLGDNLLTSDDGATFSDGVNGDVVSGDVDFVVTSTLW